MTGSSEVLFKTARTRFHEVLIERVLRLEGNVASNADKDSRASREIAFGIAQKIGLVAQGTKLKGQTSGKEFEVATAGFVSETFSLLSHLRPGNWTVLKIGEEVEKGRKHSGSEPASRISDISHFEQYRHLVAIAKAAAEYPDLAASLGSDYIIKPDVVIFRHPVPDEEINVPRTLVDSTVALRSSLRSANGGAPLLHASISCKLTIRSDRSQNSRSEAHNLIRNRRGKLPHIVVVTGEPLPSRLSSIALGGGDIDCVYHFALPELIQSVRELDLSDSEEALNIMIDGNRLKDIADLPLDLAV